MSEMTPQTMHRERAKSDCMGGEPAGEKVLFSPENSTADEIYSEG
jgi:hypothetical protein